LIDRLSIDKQWHVFVEADASNVANPIRALVYQHAQRCKVGNGHASKLLIKSLN
jgi:hypothetical protein